MQRTKKKERKKEGKKRREKERKKSKKNLKEAGHHRGIWKSFIQKFKVNKVSHEF